MKALVLLLALLCGGAAQAQAGDARAAYKAGLMARNGTGVSLNAVLAARWIELAARGGLAEAMFTWSNMLAAGEGVPPDAAAARRWLEEAAALGYPAALQELALKEPDPRQAELLMRQAAHALQHRTPPPDFTP
jgi:TPR repeat protein